MRRLAEAIERFHDRLGGWVAWCVLAMTLVGAWNALARYAGRWLGVDLASNAYIEVQWYLFSLVFLLGAAPALRHDAHVRVDVLYGRLPPRARAAVDVAGTVLFLLPFCAVALWVSWPVVADSWAVREGSPDPGGLPRYPIKAAILVAFLLLALQGLATLVRRLDDLRRPAGGGAPGDAAAPGPGGRR